MYYYYYYYYYYLHHHRRRHHRHHHHSLLYCCEQLVTKVHIPFAYLKFVAYNLKILRRHHIFTCVLPSSVFVRRV
jgi:hypothetical protein